MRRNQQVLENGLGEFFANFWKVYQFSDDFEPHNGTKFAGGLAGAVDTKVFGARQVRYFCSGKFEIILSHFWVNSWLPRVIADFAAQLWSLGNLGKPENCCRSADPWLLLIILGFYEVETGRQNALWPFALFRGFRDSSTILGINFSQKCPKNSFGGRFTEI